MADEDAAARELGIQPNLSMDDLRDVYNVLFRLGISEPSVILNVLDLAGVWLCSTCTRSEYVRVMDTDLVYVAVQALNAPIRAVTFITESHDQGWSSYSSDHNTYRNCWSWFDASIEGSSMRKYVQANVHASDVRRRHVNT
ncbi:hypothetical protein K525DRAFT_264085 [Schizophyllum commune Loenen D]|nr:hypothetical protein K525DRAFT_264085 [Schizophyllum commune Loenen D]